MALTNNGQAFLWGPISKEKSLIVPTKVQSVTEGVVDIAIGKHSFALLDQKRMAWVWGENKHS